jgi:predicted DNA-binding protein
MATTIHLPQKVLRQVDARARQLGLTRSRYICETLESDLKRHATWPEGFIDALRAVRPGDARAVDTLLEQVKRRRTRKPAPRL